jgi:hypothetical protein
MKVLLKLTTAFTIFPHLLLLASFSPAADSMPRKNEIWIHQKDGCNQGMYKQPNGPMALILFCEDALGTYIGLVYYDSPGAPVPLNFYKRLSEAEKETYYKVWSLDNRMWQDPIWASDVTSYAWGPDGTKLYVATSGIYGSGALYELDLVRKKYKQVAPTGCMTKLDKPGPGYVIMRMDKEKGRLFYILHHQSDLPAEGRKELFYKFE